MGRKPSAPKNIDKVPMPENPSLERVEPQPSTGNITLPGAVDSQLENSNPMCSPLKHPNPSVDGVVTHNEISPAQEQVNQEYGLQKKSAAYKRKKSKSLGSSVRRSERIKSAVVHTYYSNRGIEYIDDGSESEKDEPVTQMEQVLSELEPEPEPELEPEPEPAENLSEKRLNEKVENALQRLEALEEIKELLKEFLKSKVDKNAGLYEAPSMASVSYQSLYIDSQKKIEALTAKLENALGKIEVYEKENRVLVEVLDKMKDAVNATMVSNLAKATEAAVNASAQAIRTACSASAAKRKRNAQES